MIKWIQDSLLFNDILQNNEFFLSFTKPLCTYFQTRRWVKQIWVLVSVEKYVHNVQVRAKTEPDLDGQLTFLFEITEMATAIWLLPCTFKVPSMAVLLSMSSTATTLLHSQSKLRISF